MTFVFIHRAQRTDTLLISTAEKLCYHAVVGADVLPKLAGGFDQLVIVEDCRLIVRLEVSVAVRDPTLKTSLNSFLFSPSAEITGHVSMSIKAVINNKSLESFLLQQLHHVSHHGVFLQNRSWVEGVSALWTAEPPSLVILVPEALDTPPAVAVSTGNSHWILQ